MPRSNRISSTARRDAGRSGDMAMADDGRSRLGRGLAALMGDVSAEATTTPERARTQRRVPIEYLRPNPRNPRRNFSDAELDELAASIRERGIIQPVVVRSVRGAKDAYEIIAGERRWRAAQRAALHEIPIVPFEATDSEALELAIIENVQRTDLNPLEEAGGYEALASEYGHSHEHIAKIVGKSRSHVTNTLRLLKLPEPVKAYIHAGKITAGAARMLIGATDPEEMAREIVDRGLNVRQVEALAKDRASGSGKAVKKRVVKNADTIALERRVSNALGLTVTVDHRSRGGVLHIHYLSLYQLEEVLRRLENNCSRLPKRLRGNTCSLRQLGEPAGRDHSLRRAVTASVSSARCAISSAIADCRRASSAASASPAIARSSRADVHVLSAVSIAPLRLK